MGDIVLVGAAGRTRRLDLLPIEHGEDDDSDGYRNVLPGYHELRVRRDGVWHGTGFLLPPDDDGHVALAAFRLDGDARPTEATDVVRPPRDRLRDVLAQFAPTARAWQSATSAVSPAFLATPPRELKEPSLALLQVMFVFAATTEAAAEMAAPRLGQLLRRLADPARLAAAPAAGVDLARTVAAILALLPPLAAQLPLGELVGALSDVGNARGEVDLIAAASRLQLQLSKQN